MWVFCFLRFFEVGTCAMAFWFYSKKLHVPEAKINKKYVHKTCQVYAWETTKSHYSYIFKFFLAYQTGMHLKYDHFTFAH